MIFFLKMVDVFVATMRMFMVMRGRKTMAWIMGFIQALVFLSVIQIILANLDNLLNLAGYAAGFATGMVLGMSIEERLAIGFSHLRIISSGRGSQISQALRENGFAVTELTGRGKDGTVAILECSVLRRRARQIRQLVEGIDPSAMITAENVFAVWRGFLRT